jgi:DNA-binding NarL/FixJ family response regulator
MPLPVAACNLVNRTPDHCGATRRVPGAPSQTPAAAVTLPGIMTRSVIVVEDDGGLREQLVKILNSAPGVRCVGACPSAEAALALIPARKPDVVLMDIRLPAMSGIDCVAALKQMLPTLQIIMLTVYEDSESIFRALKAGASGYLVKSSPPAKLLEAIVDVSKGGAPMSSHIARKVVQHFHLAGPAPACGQDLSPREREVLDLLASGYIYKEIGDKLGIGTETVRTYVKNICEKMHVRSRLEAVARRRQA